jgi:hypothetical protein
VGGEDRPQVIKIYSLSSLKTMAWNHNFQKKNKRDKTPQAYVLKAVTKTV